MKLISEDNILCHCTAHMHKKFKAMQEP